MLTANFVDQIIIMHHFMIAITVLYLTTFGRPWSSTPLCVAGRKKSTKLKKEHRCAERARIHVTSCVQRTTKGSQYFTEAAYLQSLRHLAPPVSPTVMRNVGCVKYSNSNRCKCGAHPLLYLFQFHSPSNAF